MFPFANVFLKMCRTFLIIFSIVLALGKRLSCQYKGTLTIMVNVVRFMYKLYIMFQDMIIYRRPVVVFLVCVYEWLLQNYSIAVVLLLN